jgi:hypothetical protein
MCCGQAKDRIFSVIGATQPDSNVAEVVEAKLRLQGFHN